MAKFYISEFPGHLHGVPIAPPLANQAAITVGAVANTSQPFQANTRCVRVSTDVACCLGFNADATANGSLLPANQAAVFTVNPGGTISVITP